MYGSLPSPRESYSDLESLDLRNQYLRDPSALSCPHCGVPRTIEVLCFIEPEPQPGDTFNITEPVGTYAAAVYCHSCKHGIGLAFREDDL